MNAPHTLAALRRRHWLLQAAAAVATATLASTGGAQTAKLPTKGGEPVELKWDDLVPKGWDPMKGLPANAGNLAILGDGCHRQRPQRRIFLGIATERKGEGDVNQCDLGFHDVSYFFFWIGDNGIHWTALIRRR